jgi:hypothetical protein
MGAFDDWLDQPDPVQAEPLTTPATPQPKSRFDSWFDGPTEQDSRLGSNLAGAASTTPDAHQKAVDVGKTIGAPADSVASSMPESEKQARLQRYRDALNDAPKLQKLLAEDPDLAKLSADDLEGLGKTESTFSKLLSAYYGIGPGNAETLSDLGQSAVSGTVSMFASGAGGVADLNDVLARTAARVYRGVGLDTLGDLADPETRPWWLRPQRVLEVAGDELKDVAKAIDIPEDRQNIATDISKGVGQVAGQIALALLTGGTATTAMLAGQGADIMSDRVEAAGAEGTAAGDVAIVGGAAVTAVLEKLGLDALLKRVPPAIKNGILRQITDIGLAGGIEAVEEVVEGILHNMIEMVTVNPDATALDWEGMKQDAAAGGGTGAVVRALVNAATKGRQISANTKKEMRAGQDAATVEALVTGTAESKLRDRNPDAFAQVMAAQTQGTPIETFYVPAERIAELYQTGGPVVDGVDPLDQIEGLREQIAEALAVGGDVEISAADYLTHIAPTDVHGKLKNDLRASRDGWSVNDAKEFSENPEREADLAALVERIGTESEAALVGQKTFDDVYRQLMDTGRYQSNQAAAQAQFIRDRYLTKAKRRGLSEDPDALYEADRLQVLGPGVAGTMAPAGALDQTRGMLDVDPNDLEFREAEQNRLDAVRETAEAGDPYNPIVLIADGGQYSILDGHNRAAVARERGERLPAVAVTRAEYDALKDDYDDTEIAYAALSLGEDEAAEEAARDLGRQFPGARVVERGMAAASALSDLRDAAGEVLLQRAPPKPLGTDPKELAHTVVDILYGDTPAIKANTREVGDIARDLMTRGQKALRALGVKGGRIDGPDPKTDEIISRAIATEIKAALASSTRNASDWYTRKVEEALTIAALMHPEIATDPIAEMGFTAALAITSQGETVPSNVRLADPIYRIFKETGRFPTEVKAKGGPAMGINFAKLNKLLDERGPEGTREFLHQQFTVGDLKKAGYPIGGENVGTVVYGSAILGPKIGGGFFQNLNRNYSPVTMDLWFMRAWGRLTGSLVGNPDPASLQKQKDRLTTAMEAAGRKVPKTDAALQKQAEEIRITHERDFVKNRKLYDSGEKAKAEITYAAERYLIGLNGINEQPGSGSERVWMRQRVGRAQELLAQEGTTLTAADLQAVWWYPEKDLYAKLGGRDSEAINVDYAGALTELARSKGIDDDTITRAVGSLDQRSGPTGRTDDGRADDGGGQGDQGSGALFQAENAGRDARSGDPGAHEPQGLYARGSGGSGGKLLLGDLPAVARWEPTGNGPVLFELEPSPAAAQAFSAAIRASKENNAHGAAVYVYGDYAGMRMFLTEDHLAGIALKGDDTVSVFNTRGSPHKKAGVHLVRLAVQLGGRRLDAFDTVLPEIYAQAGFSVAARLPWDESQAPEGWDKAVFERWNNGTPDVVFMAYTGRTGTYEQGEGPYAVDYDDAVRLQREAIDDHEAAGQEREFFQSDAGRGDGGGGGRAQADPGPLPGEPAASQTQARLEGLPASSPGGVQAIRDAAERYLQARGLPVRRQARFVVADPARGARIATAYADMLHAPQDPAVVAAYRAMIDETLAQYQEVKRLGMVVEVIEPGMPDPYPGGPKEVLDDLHRNHLWLFPTDSGFGTLTEISDNPLLEPTEEFIGERRLLANDVFRIVHDVFGHGKEGVGFGPSGEENAWQSHVLMYSPLAARAMTSETRGQNSWVNFGPYGEANRTNQRETVYADQKVGLLPEWASTEAIAAKPLEELGQGVQGSYQQTLDPYGKPTNIIRLTQGANLSTFLHESSHFFLFQLIDDSFDASPEARIKLQQDLQKILDHVGVKLTVATSSANAVHAAMTREAHELWARSFEVYLREGKAPSSSLRDSFASFASWLVRIYKNLKSIPDYTKRLTPEVRGVMDRLLATDEAIKEAQEAVSFRVPAALRSVMTQREQKSLERLTEQATQEAQDELRKRVMKELARERLEWWQEERARVRAQVEEEVRNRPAYRAYNLLRHGEMPDGSQTLDADGNPARTRLDRQGFVQAYGKDVLKLLPKGVTAENGENHEVFATWAGFGSGDQLRDALVGLQPMKGVIDSETDARMKAQHGDMLSDLEKQASEVILNQRQVELAALQAKVLARLAASVEKKAEAGVKAGKREAVRRIQTGLDAKAIAAAAKKAIRAKRIEDAVPARYRAQADRLGSQVEKAIGKGDYETAARLKEQQLVNLALAKEAQEVQERVTKAIKRFARLRKPDSKLAAATDVDALGAARAILSVFGLSSPQVGFDQQVWFQKMAEQDPVGATDTRAMIDAATAGAGQVAARGRTRTRQQPGGQPEARGQIWRQMTVDEFGSLTDAVDAILAMGRDERSVELEGERLEIKATVAEMLAQASGRDSGKRIGQTEAATNAEKRTRSFWGLAAFLERTESWARRMDDGKVGPFTKYLVRPVLAAVYEYRAEKTKRIKQLVDILEPADLLGKPIHSTELNYTFANKGALLHAILHSGNDSNFRKLLLGGRGKGFAWGRALPDGTLDRSRWDSMIRRFVQEGVLTKQDFDTAQAIWDLLEELKGPAQIAHRKMKGYYFNEVEVIGIDTPFGRYRGGYVPAVSDKLLNPEAGARVDANAMGDMANAGILPSVAKGFTKSRVEYNQPLELNISRLTGHMDTVLKFTHLGPVIRNVTRLVINREFRQEMFGIDAHAIDEVLVPWLQRVARQTVEVPPTSEGARTAAKFFKGLQKRTGIQAMAGNLLNAAQQITGLQVAMVRVKPHRVLRGLVSSTFAPRHSSQMIMQKSAFMRDRMDSTSMELMTTINDLLEQKSAFRKLRDKTDKHGYFAQIYAQNLVDRAVWLGAYEQGIAGGKTEAEAVLEADSVVRTTQSSFAPEDVSRVEVQNAFVRPFLQFYSYFNAQYNVLRTEFDATVTELGWVGGSPRLFYIYLMGAALPAVLAEAMTQAARGELGDDDDGLIDDIGEMFLLSQLRYFAAMVPGVGPVTNLLIHLGNDKPYDDRLSTAPAIGQVERIGTSGYKLATGTESSAGRAVQDALTILGMLTGLPLGQAGKPLGYFADVATGEQEGDDLGDWARGLLSGREAPKQ